MAPPPARLESVGATKPPIVHPGELTPHLIQLFESCCLNFFAFKGIDPALQVARVAAGLLDPRVQAWYTKHRDAYNNASFPEFITELRAMFLPTDWAIDLRRKIGGSYQGNLPFSEWENNLSADNALLLGLQEYMEENLYRHHLESHMDSTLQKCCHDKGIDNTVSFKIWKEKVKREEEHRLEEKKERLQEFQKLIDDANKKNKNANSGSLASRIANAGTGSSNTNRTK